MANLCLYKIKVNARKKACYALIDMMPLYDWDKEILLEEGTDDDYTIIFTGGCKWGVDYATKKIEGLKPFTEEELDAVRDGDHWGYPLRDKSLALNADIYCNSKDIGDSRKPVYEHYSCGKKINDKCPEDINIERGLDYDKDYKKDKSSQNKPASTTRVVRIKFVNGRSYEYISPIEVKEGDIVKVEGTMAGMLGQVVSVKYQNLSLYKVVEFISNGELFKENDIETFWKKLNKDEKEKYYNEFGLTDKDRNKKKFITTTNGKWIEKCAEGMSWKEFKKYLSDIKK